MDQKISDLDVAISMSASDLIPIVDSNGNNKVLHGSQVKDYVADAVVSDIDDVKAMISDEYDPERVTPYEAGDLVIYNNTLKKCLDTTSGAWDSTKWDDTTIETELNELKSKTDRLTITGNPSTDNPLHFTVESGWSCNDMIVSKLDKQIHLHGTFVSSTVINTWRMIGYFDDSTLKPTADIVTGTFSDDDITAANTKLARFVFRKSDGKLQASNDNPNALRMLIDLIFEIA